MTVPLSLISAAVGLAVFILIGKVFPTRSKSSQPTPPGPKGLPLIGNLLDMPRKSIWDGYAEFGKKYGTIYLLGMYFAVTRELQRNTQIIFWTFELRLH
jgi:hypothetical protein